MSPEARFPGPSKGNPSEDSAPAEGPGGRIPSFFLEREPRGGSFALTEEDREHALRVLRLGPGDRLWGLDGRGAAWPLRVRSAGRQDLELEAAGEPRRTAAPGEHGASLPWIEVAMALPRAGRLEEALDALVQIGVAALRPLTSDRSHPSARRLSAHRLERLARVTRGACKQSGRLWLPEIHPPAPVEQLLRLEPASTPCLLLPEAERRLAEWADAPETRRAGRRDRPLLLVIGPEGGFSPEEHGAFRAAGVAEACLGPHVLRIETAAVAAAAILAHAFHAPLKNPSAP